jgi:hypothetical protein
MHILDGTFPPGSEAAVVQAFVRAGSRTPAAARSLWDLGVEGTRGARTLVRRELLRESAAGSGRFYLDTAHYHRRQRRQQLGVLATMIALGLAIAAAVTRGV